MNTYYIWLLLINTKINIFAITLHFFCDSQILTANYDANHSTTFTYILGNMVPYTTLQPIVAPNIYWQIKYFLKTRNHALTLHSHPYNNSSCLSVSSLFIMTYPVTQI